MAPDISLEFPFVYTEVESLGELFYPIIQVRLKTIFGWKEFDFLVDTGADVTTLPETAASFLPVDLKKLKQTTTYGVGGISISTYSLILPIKIGRYEFKIHASIIKDKNTPFLLGRKDVFDRKFSLIVDSKENKTILRLNS